MKKLCVMLAAALLLALLLPFPAAHIQFIMFLRHGGNLLVLIV